MFYVEHLLSNKRKLFLLLIRYWRVVNKILRQSENQFWSIFPALYILNPFPARISFAFQLSKIYNIYNQPSTEVNNANWSLPVHIADFMLTSVTIIIKVWDKMFYSICSCSLCWQFKTYLTYLFYFLVSTIKYQSSTSVD